MLPKLKPSTHARLRAFVDVVQVNLDKLVDAVRPVEQEATPHAAGEAEDLLEEVRHG